MYGGLCNKICCIGIKIVRLARVLALFLVMMSFPFNLDLFYIFLNKSTDYEKSLASFDLMLRIVLIRVYIEKIIIGLSIKILDVNYYNNHREHGDHRGKKQLV